MFIENGINFIVSNRDENLISMLEKALEKYDIDKIFNPSYIFYDDMHFFTFKVSGANNHESRVIIIDENGDTKHINIGEKFKNQIRRALDPKFVILDSKLYITFNNGNLMNRGSIYLVSIYPEIGPLITAGLSVKSRSVEKNWAFYERDDEVYALYWPSPLKIIKRKFY